MIFGILRKSDMNILQVCPPHLSDVCLPSLLWEIQKSHFRLYYSYILLIIYIISGQKSEWENRFSR